MIVATLRIALMMVRVSPVTKGWIACKPLSTNIPRITQKVLDCTANFNLVIVLEGVA